MIYRGNDVEAIILYLPKDRMKGKISSERMRRTLFYLVLECSDVLLSSEFDTFQSLLEKVSRHLLRRWRIKKQKRSDGKCRRSRTNSCCNVSKSLYIIEGSHSNSCKCQTFNIRLLRNPIDPVTTRIVKGKPSNSVSFRHHKT